MSELAIFQCVTCGSKRVYGDAIPERPEYLILCEQEQANRIHKFLDLKPESDFKWRSNLPHELNRSILVSRNSLGLPPLELEELLVPQIDTSKGAVIPWPTKK